jgi:hypothetical protein
MKHLAAAYGATIFGQGDDPPAVVGARLPPFRESSPDALHVLKERSERLAALPDEEIIIKLMAGGAPREVAEAVLSRIRENPPTVIIGDSLLDVGKSIADE